MAVYGSISAVVTRPYVCISIANYCINAHRISNFSFIILTFAIWSPDHATVQLKLDGTLYPMGRITNANGYTDLYAVEVAGNFHLKHYSFVLDGKTVRDPYGVMVDASTTSSIPDHIVMDLSQTALSSGWSATPALVQREDAVIYELHVRDFTIDASACVTAAKRGKYAGMTQTGITLLDAGIQYRRLPLRSDGHL
jgi:pullulanase/glycogen debranching enzyme